MRRVPPVREFELRGPMRVKVSESVRKGLVTKEVRLEERRFGAGGTVWNTSEDSASKKRGGGTRMLALK